MMVYVLSRAVGIATNTMALYDEVPPYMIEWAVYGFGSPIVLADSGHSIHLNTDKSGHVRTSLRRFWGLGSLSPTSVPENCRSKPVFLHLHPRAPSGTSPACWTQSFTPGSGACSKDSMAPQGSSQPRMGCHRWMPLECWATNHGHRNCEFSHEKWWFSIEIVDFPIENCVFP